MRVLSWNVQYGKSNDGTMDFRQILQHIESMGEFDVICLQELSRFMDEYCAPGQHDQLQMVRENMEQFDCLWGAGFSWPSKTGDTTQRQEFGNVTLVKSGLLDFKVHQLPRPATPGKQQMQRIGVETVVESAIGPVSIINTHLAFHDDNENQLQLEQFATLEQERKSHHREPKKLDSGVYQAGYLPVGRIL